MPAPLMSACLSLVGGILFLNGTNVIAQSTVTTLTDANNGHAGYVDGNTFSKAQFNNAAGLALDPSEQNLFVADSLNNAVRWVTQIGDKANSMTYSAYVSTNGVNCPVDIAIDNNTNIYVLNRGNGKNGSILKFNGFYYLNYGIKWPSATNATILANLTNATAITLDSAGNLYATINSNMVVLVGLNSYVTVGIITNSGTSLRGITVRQDGMIALTDAGNNGIWLMDPANTNLTGNSTELTGFNGAGDVLGPPGFAAFNRPEKITKAGNNYLVVADYNNNKVKVIDASGTVTRLFGVSSSYWNYNYYPGWADGTVNPIESSDTVQARSPYGVVMASDGTVYDTENYYQLLRMATGTGLPSLPPPPPAAPVLWSATPSYGQVILSWSTVSGAASYNVKWSPSPGGPYTTIATSSSTSYTDTTVVNGTTNYYVVSAINSGGVEGPDSAEISAVVPIPPPATPIIGWFDLEGNAQSGFSTKLHPVSGAPFITHNDLNLAIDPNTGSINSGVSTYYTTDGSYPSATNSSSSTPPPYSDGQPSAQPLPVPATPDLTVKAMNVNAGGNSAVATAEFIYQVGNPVISGTNAAQFTVSDITSGTYFVYTTDGSDPTTNANATVVGPVTGTNGITLSLQFPPNSNSMTFQVVGKRPNYLDSAVVAQTFSITNFAANTISFGFGNGEASSDFVAASGQTFYAPVTLTTLPNTKIYSLQFNITVTNNGVGPAINNAFGFQSMLLKPDPNNPGYYITIPPAMFNGTSLSSLEFTNSSLGLLGVGWLERATKTNLYDTKSQTLVSFSEAHDDLFPNSAQPFGVILGGYALHIPSSATNGQQYQIQIGRPSATDDGIGAPGSSVYIVAPTNGTLAGGLPLNALKLVTVGQRKYIAGSVYPFRWFNAGDFGSSNIVNADVEQVFQSAVYSLNYPPEGSDLFDAMDSCGNIGVLDGNTGYYTNTAIYPYHFTYSTTNTTYIYTNNILINTASQVFTNTADIYVDTTSISAAYADTAIYYTSSNVTTNTTNLTTVYYFPNQYVPNLFDGNDTNINQIAFGDGKLDVCDVYVTYRRSLDPSLYWFSRFWTNGERVAEIVPNVSPQVQSQMVTSTVSTSMQPATSTVSTTPPQVNFSAGDIQGSAGQTVQVPIYANILGSYPLRVLMLNLTVSPLDGSPALTNAVQFTPNTALGSPYTTDSVGNGNYAAVWLNSTIAGLTGNAIIGTLTVTIPATASTNSAYAVHFDHASASPNGLATFPDQTLTGLITLSSRTNSSYGDGIPDSWRLRWFGTVNNYLSVSNACPSGDGINNWMKYVAGVDPNVANDFPSTKAKTPVPAGYTAAIHWPTVDGKKYVIMRSSSLFEGSWTAISTNTGTGEDMEFDDNSPGATKFYRVRILP